LPQATERSQAAGLGDPVTLREAERRTSLQLLLPPVVRPARAYVLGNALATVVFEAYGKPVRLSQFGSFGPGSLQKLVTQETQVEPARVSGSDALWIEGPHAFEYFGQNGFHQAPVREHGNVLLWLHGDLTLRLEGPLSKAQALELARRIR